MSASDIFHAGELAVQKKAGAGDIARFAAGFVIDYLPAQHRAFYQSLPFLVMAARDDQNRPWASILEGPDDFVTAPDPTRMVIAARPTEDDPLAGAISCDRDIGILGIDLATRRRNRINGRIATGPDGPHMTVTVDQAFGNCPQYIRPRRIERTATQPSRVLRSSGLSSRQMAWVHGSDTFFIATGYRGDGKRAAWGMDASHRGGPPGFVTVSGDGTRLRFPDYSGNNFFNTLGNIMRNPRLGLLFVDFATGSLLHLTGQATIDWSGETDSGAQRHVDVEVEAVVERAGALSLRWGEPDASERRLRLAERRRESADVVSFTFAAEDGTALPDFVAGQHLPIAIQPNGGPRLERSYSLSGAPGTGRYRISVKREGNGAVSRLLHDAFGRGSTLSARSPAGRFGPDDPDAPLVLISAGIGLTPLVSHLHAAASSRSERRVWFIHGARNGAHHPFAQEVRDLVARHPNLSTRFAYSRPGPADVKGRDYDWSGRLTVAHVLQTVSDIGAHFLVCGPPAFVWTMRRGLAAAGIADDRLHEETF